MLRIHKIVKVMDSPKRRKRINKHLRKRSKVTNQSYLTFMEVVRLVEERYADKYKP